MHPGAIAFGYQFGLGGQPMLHGLTVRQTIVHIRKVSPPGHFIRGRHKRSLPLSQSAGRKGMRGCRVMGVILGGMMVFHKGEMNCGTGSGLVPGLLAKYSGFASIRLRVIRMNMVDLS